MIVDEVAFLADHRRLSESLAAMATAAYGADLGRKDHHDEVNHDSSFTVAASLPVADRNLKHRSSPSRRDRNLDERWHP
jgi:hypothetical protein